MASLTALEVHREAIRTREPEDKFRATVALLIVGLLIVMCGQIVALVKGADYSFSVASVGSEASTGGSWCFISNYTLSLSTQQFVLEEVNVYANGIDEDARLRVAIYNEYSLVIEYGEWVAVPSGWHWVTSDFDDCILGSGTFLYAVEFNGNVSYHVLDIGRNGYTINVLSDYLEGLNSWSTYAVRAYGTGYTTELGEVIVTDRANDWMSFAIVIVLAIVNIALCLVPIPFLNFLLGILSLSVTGASLASVFPLDGWVTGFLLLTSLATLIIGVLRYRG